MSHASSRRYTANIEETNATSLSRFSEDDILPFEMQDRLPSAYTEMPSECGLDLEEGRFEQESSCCRFRTVGIT
ncbi:hypothetical protein DPMN_062831 [Dreissena polymorpha]|uniref:Uncharacterized protein n=1 Tax=Dreissena polymorpha TaxID=45954 RepID=A0A9D4HKI3_DREPO|nr:hypothetical protein DPMN_062831 [Dreissena polymorpha]